MMGSTGKRGYGVQYEVDGQGAPKPNLRMILARAAQCRPGSLDRVIVGSLFHTFGPYLWCQIFCNL